MPSPRLLASGRGWTGRRRRRWRPAAVLHDIACPLCRERYGNTDGKRQEREGLPVGSCLFRGQRLAPGTHRPGGLPGRAPPHLKKVVGLDHQILLKADHLVNAGESGDSEEAIYRMREVLFRTPTPAPPCSTKSIWRADCGPCMAGAEGAHPFIRKDFSPGGGGEPPQIGGLCQKRRRGFSCRNRSR